jgi:uncharacterized protein (TIGR02611 family)
MRRREQLAAIKERIRANRTARLSWQIIIAVIGATVVTVGIILIPFPGPGWLIVLAGLAIWAVEFVWAQRLLRFTRVRLEAWWYWLGRQHWTTRLLAGAIGLAFVLTVAWLSLLFSLGAPSLADIWHSITDP